MKVAANNACNGAENMPLDNKNSAAQQNIKGVVMNTLYGLPSTFDFEGF
jgi:hypothetical protein